MTNRERHRICRDILACKKQIATLKDISKLNNFQDKKVYEDLKKEYGDIVSLVQNYEAFRKAAYDCCREWFIENTYDPNKMSDDGTGKLPVVYSKDAPRSVNFQTVKLEGYFKSFEEIQKHRSLARYRFGSGNDGIQSWIIIQKKKGTVWTDTQNKMIDVLNSVPEIVKPSGSSVDSKSPLFCTILNDDLLGENVTDDIKKMIRDNLDELKRKINEIENVFDKKL